MTITQEYEVPVVHPGEQGARLGGVRAGHGQRSALELVGDGAHALQHRAEVGHRFAHVVERALQAPQQLARLRFVGGAVDLHHLPGFGRAGALVIGKREQPAARVATHPEHRMHDEMHRDAHRAEDDADGVDQEGHVGGDHAHQRAVRAARGIAIERRRQLDQRVAALAQAPELEMGQRGRGEVRGLVHAQVVLGDTAEELPHESGREGAIAPRRASGVRGYLLDQCQAGGGNLAEHAEPLWKGGDRRGARLYMSAAAAQSACAGPSSTARPSNTRTSRSSVARSRLLSGATRLRSYSSAMGTTRA